MNVTIYDDNGELRSYTIDQNNYKIQKDLPITSIGSQTKESNILKLIEIFYTQSKGILYDSHNTLIKNKIEQFDLKKLKPYDFSLLYFTSGTTGSAVGALKTQENIVNELIQLHKLFSPYTIKKIIVTVPFIHFYGSLLGVFYPLWQNIDIVFKEHFLPNDLLEICEPDTMVVTTPLYIKSLNRLSTNKKLQKTLFISSTAPLFPDIAQEFHQKFHTDVIQIFGSTETGGIAYKYNDQELWNPFESVIISQNDQGELKVKSPFVSPILYEDRFIRTHGTIQTFDYVVLEDKQFKLIGRSSQIIKIAGKRYSTIQIENILEKEPDIEKAVVYVTANKEALRGEELNIILQTKKTFSTQEIKNLLKSEFINIRFSINLQIVETIQTTSVGKKMLIQ